LPFGQSYFYGESLCALAKKDGGIRHITIECTLRHLLTKVTCRAVRDQVAAHPAPIQLGKGIKKGTEATAHATRHFLQNRGPHQVLLKLDFKNAVNNAA